MNKSMLALAVAGVISSAQLSAADSDWIDAVGWTDGSNRIFQVNKNHLISDPSVGQVFLWARFKNDPTDNKEMAMVFDCTDDTYAIIATKDPVTGAEETVQPRWASILPRQTIVGMVHTLVCEVQKSKPKHSI